MKLSQAQVKVIMETIFSAQEYDVPVIFGNRIRLIRNEIEKDYLTTDEDRMAMIAKYKPNEKGKYSSEDDKKMNEEYAIMLNAEKEYNIEPIPLNIQERADKLPLKFFLNLDPILAKE